MFTYGYQLVDRDHAQEFQRHFLEHGRDADLVLGLELAALDARNRRVQAQRVVDDVDLAVVLDLVDRLGVAQIFGLQLLHVLVQRLVGAQLVRLGIAFEQHFAQLVLRQQLLDLLLGLFGISAEILQGRHGGYGERGAVTERDGAGREYSTSVRRHIKAALPAADLYPVPRFCMGMHHAAHHCALAHRLADRDIQNLGPAYEVVDALRPAADGHARSAAVALGA